MPIREGLLVQKGLDPDTVPFQTARIVEERDISRWLPIAIASLYRLVAAYGMKRLPKLSDILKSWGLSHDANEMDQLEGKASEMATENALKNFFRKVKTNG